MGGIASKSARNLSRKLPETAGKANGVKLNKKLGSDFLDIDKEVQNKRQFGNKQELNKGQNDKPTNNKEHPKVYTERPKEENFGYEDEEAKSDLFHKAVDMGLLRVKEEKQMPKTGGKFNKQDPSIQLLQNRKKMEDEYESLLVSEKKIKYDVPKRFLTREQQEKEGKTYKKAENVYGLVDSNDLSDLIKAYKVEGRDKFDELAKKKETKEENRKLLAAFIDSGLVNLPTSRVTLVRRFDKKGKITNEKFVMIHEDWVREEKAKLKRKGKKAKKGDEVEDAPEEILSQFKKLESLIRVDKEKKPDERKRKKTKAAKKTAGSELKRFL